MLQRKMIYWSILAIPLHVMCFTFVYVEWYDSDTHWILWTELAVMLTSKCLVMLNFIRYLRMSYCGSFWKSNDISEKWLYLLWIGCVSPFVIQYNYNQTQVIIIVYHLYIAPLRSALSMDKHVQIAFKYGIFVTLNSVSLNICQPLSRLYFGSHSMWNIIDSICTICGIALIHGTPANLHDTICCHSHKTKCAYDAFI
eukprot:471703_1